MKDKPAVKILFLGANARNTTRLKLGVEVRDVRGAIDTMGTGCVLVLEAELAVRPTDLQALLLKHKPDIIHFSGHGSGPGGARADLTAEQAPWSTRDFLPQEEDAGVTDDDSDGGLLLEDERGAAVTVKPEALTELLRIVQRKSPLRCVMLNACFTVEQATTIASYVDCVIGMKRAIDDSAAIAFAIGFYRALAHEMSAAMAFEYGCNEIRVRRLPDADAPTLFHRPGMKPDQVFVGLPDESAGIATRFPWRLHLGRAAPMALALLGILAVAALLLPPVWVPLASPASDTIVVAGPWLGGDRGREARRALCRALEKNRREGEGLRCIDLPLVGADPEEVRKKATQAGASLLVLVDNDGIARIRPLGPLADDEIFDRGLPLVELSESTLAAVAPVLRSLAHLARIAGDLSRLDSDRLRCVTLDAAAPRSTMLLALLTGMFVPGCAPGRVAAQTLLGSCDREPFVREECTLAIFLSTYRSPSADLIEKLGSDTAYRPWSAAMLQSGRLACTRRRLDDAKQAMDQLWESQDVCVRLTASIIAACLLSEDKTLSPEEESDLRAIESFADGGPLVYGDERGNCEEAMRGSVLGGRAWGRARGGRFAEAAADYRDAQKLDREHKHVYGANLVEVLLHRGEMKEANEELMAIESDVAQREQERVHHALLAWLVARRERDSTRIEVTSAKLLDAYRTFGGERIFEDSSDPVLRPLACPGGDEDCVFTILAEKKTGDSEGILKKALDAMRAYDKSASYQ